MAAARRTMTDETEESEELITDKFLAKIADNLGNIYFQLGMAMNVKRSYIQRQEHDHRGDTLRINFEVLAKWRKTSKHKTNLNAMVEELTDTLTQLDQVDVVEIIRREFPSPYIRLLGDDANVSTEENWFDEEDVRRLLLQVSVPEGGARHSQDKVNNPRAMSTRRPGPEVTHKVNNPRAMSTRRPGPEVTTRDKMITRLEDCARPVRGETSEEKKQRILRVMRLLCEWKEPSLWHRVAKHLTSDGQLNLTGAITSATLPDLLHLLQSGEARDVTLLNIGATYTSASDYDRLLNVFDDVTAVKRLCLGLSAMPQLQKLGLVACQLTDDGFAEICNTIRANCGQLTWLGCWGNDNLTSSIKKHVSMTMKELPALKLFLYECSLSSDCCKSLHKKFRGRIYVDM